MAPKPPPTSHRLSAEARQLLLVLADTLSLSQTGVLEIAIREMGKREQVGPYRAAGDTRQLDFFPSHVQEGL